MTNAVIYCRVSTEDQEKEGTSLKTQLEACENYCRSRGYNVSQTFCETYSGLALHRPVLSDLRDVLRAKPVNVIVVYCIDRLSRDPAHGVILMQEFDRLKVRLEAVSETIESSDMGKLVTYIRGFASKIEAEKIKERTMRGKSAFLKEGKLPQGTGVGIYGYDWNKETKHRIINEPEALIVRNIFASVIRGEGVNKVAAALNKAGVTTKTGSVWYPFTVKRLVTNIVYTGKTYYGQTKRTGKSTTVIQPKENWIALPEVTPAIVTDEVFTRAQDTLVEIKNHRPLKPNAAYLLTGFVKCAKCGSTVGGTMLSGKYRYYQCRGAKPTATRGKICDAGYIKAGELEHQVLEHLTKLLSNPMALLNQFLGLGYDSKNSIIPVLEKQIGQLEDRLKGYHRKEQNLYDLLSNDNVTKDMVLDTVNELKRKRREDERQLESLQESLKKASKYRFLDIKLSDYSKIISDHPLDNGDRQLLKALDVQIIAQPKSFKITSYIELNLLPKGYDTSQEPIIWDNINEFETKHPEYTIQDLVDYGQTMPDDTIVGRYINQKKYANKLAGYVDATAGYFSHHCTNMGITCREVVRLSNRRREHERSSTQTLNDVTITTGLNQCQIK